MELGTIVIIVVGISYGTWMCFAVKDVVENRSGSRDSSQAIVTMTVLLSLLYLLIITIICIIENWNYKVF